MLLTIVTLIFVTFISYLLFLEWNHKRKYGHIPGPRGLPFVGNFFDLNQKDSSGRARSMQDILVDWRYEFGPTFKFRIGPFNTHVVFGTYDTILESMVTKAKVFAGKPQQYRMELTGDQAGLGGMTATPLCKKLRKLCHKSFRLYDGGQEVIENIVLEAFDDTFEKLRNRKDKKVNLQSVIMDENTDILYILLFGKSGKYKEMTISTMKDLLNAWALSLQSSLSGFLLDTFPFLRLFPSKVYDACVSFRNLNDNFWRKQLKEHKMSWNGEDEMCFIDSIRLEQKCLQETGDPIRINENTVISMGGVIYMAGLTTMTSTMNSIILAMANDNTIQERLYQEIISVFGAEGKVTSKKRDMLPYMRAVIFEALRRTTPVPIPIPREATADTDVGGFSIPKGTPVMINVHGVHHDPEIWEDSYAFRPERFLDPDGNLVPARHINRKRIMSFGAGDRACVGEQVALNRMFLFLVMLIQRFRVEPLDGEILPSDDPRDFVHGLIEAPDAYNVNLVPR